MTETMDKEAARWYLAGLFDGEGSVTHLPRKDRPSWARCLRIASCDRELLDRAGQACEALGISYKISLTHAGGGRYRDGRPRKPAWGLRIHRKWSIVQFHRTVPIAHIAKKEKLRILATEIGDPIREHEIIPAVEPVPGREPDESPAEPVTVPAEEPDRVPA